MLSEVVSKVLKGDAEEAEARPDRRELVTGQYEVMGRLIASSWGPEEDSTRVTCPGKVGSGA